MPIYLKPTPPKREPVGKYDAAIIKFVDDYWRTHYHAPTLREIGAACGTSSISVTRNAVTRVARKQGWRITHAGQRCITPAWVIRALNGAKEPNG